MNTLQKFLTANAIFSFLNGLLSITFRRELESLFRLEQSHFFLILGILLLCFAISVAWEVKRQGALAILWIIIQDMLWVLGSGILWLWNPFNISTEGLLIVGFVAVVVLLLALGQVVGLQRMDEGQRKGQKHFTFKRRVSGTRAQTWEVISDVGNYHEVAPNIETSNILSGEKKGMVRGCSHGEDSWTETCTLWEEGKQYSFVVETQAPDYPYPLKSLKGTWIVDELSDMESEITMVFEFTYKKPIQNILVHPFMKYRFTKVCEELLDNWQERIEG